MRDEIVSDDSVKNVSSGERQNKDCGNNDRAAVNGKLGMPLVTGAVA